MTEFEKGRIHELRQSSKSLMEIAKLLNRSKGCIQGYIKRSNSKPAKKRRGRPRKISDRGVRQVLRTLKRQRRANCRQLQNLLPNQISRWTIYRLLKKAKFRWSKMQKRPKWSENHLEKRRNFGKRYQTYSTEWRSVIFSDEKKFNLDGPDGFKYYWHQLGDKYQYYSRRQFGGKSVMVWAGFAYGGKLEVKFIKGTLNAAKYQSLLEQSDLNGQGALIAGGDMKFQHDNAPIHSVSLSIYILKHLSFLYL